MKFQNVILHSISYHLPDSIMTSSEIENKLSSIYQKNHLSEGRLEMMTGIKERRYWDRGVSPGLMAAKAGKKTLEKVAFAPEKVDQIFYSSVCRDFLEPATATIVHRELGLSPHCGFLDLSNACLGVVNAMFLAASLIDAGSLKSALIVSGENSGPLLLDTLDTLLQNPQLKRKQIKKLFANFTIGSAAVGLLLTHRSLRAEGPGLLGGVQMVDSHQNHLCQGSGDKNSLMMETDSEKLMKVGISLAQKTWNKLQGELNLGPQYIIGHQVGKAHQEKLLQSLGLKSKETFNTYPWLGNTGSAALPITLAKFLETDYQENAQLALLGIGSGLGSIMLGMKL